VTGTFDHARQVSEMNIREDTKQLKTDDRDLRKFGLMVGGVFAVLGLLFLWRHPGRSPYFLWPGGVLIVAGAILPRALKWVYIGWMSVAFVLGFVMAHIILTLFFFLVITPVGLLARLFGQDFLSRKLDHAAKSYWIPREKKVKSPAEYERQF
jgi:hypothetical protein